MNLSFKNLWEQLKTGEDIDLYFYLVAAAILSIVSSLGYKPDDKGFSFLAAGIASIIISVLSVRYLSIKILGKVEEFKEFIDEQNKNDCQSYSTEWPQTLYDDLKRAENLCFYGIHLHDTIDLYYDLIAEKVYQGKTVKFLFPDPKGSVWNMVKMRYPGEVGADLSMMSASLDRIKDLQKKYPNLIEIRCIDYLFPRTAYIMNPQKIDGCAYISSHTFRMGSKKSKKLYKKDKGNWFHLIYEEFCKMWEYGDQIN